jgi:hypothetical protein
MFDVLNELVIPLAGLITATVLFFSPLKEMLRISKSRVIGTLNIFPLAMIAPNCLAWMVSCHQWRTGQFKCLRHCVRALCSNTATSNANSPVTRLHSKHHMSCQPEFAKLTHLPVFSSHADCSHHHTFAQQVYAVFTNNIWLWWSNLPSFMLALWYMSVAISCQDFKISQLRLVQYVCGIGLALDCLGLMQLIVIPNAEQKALRKNITGAICMLMIVVFYSSPMTGD